MAELDGAATLAAIDLCGHCLRPRAQHSGKDCSRWEGTFITLNDALAERRVLRKRLDRLARGAGEAIDKLSEYLKSVGKAAQNG